MLTRTAVIFIGALIPVLALGQGGDQQVRTKADALFEEQRFAEAFPLYSQLVSLTPSDRQLNYRFGTCSLFGSEDKERAIGHLKFATEDPSIPALAWYWLGRAYHLNYRFKEAQMAYQRFLGTGDRKAIAAWPVDALDKQCRNGEKLLSNLKEITVRNKVEVADEEFFRFYDLSDIGGKIVVLPEELATSIDKKKKERSLVYLPGKGGPFYFSSYGRDGSTGRDIYRTELLPDGTFATPVKLAGYINTEQDENYAFMHPDGKTFYFSSKGHNSMGGYDVFRAMYDRGLDAFGRPENLDFAVNTPDDDIFYMVDAEQKEACFASGRNSHQGMLHVYRVATVQQPVVISVFKGTFASNIDPEDRKAHVVVDDAVTRERVADVTTDLNGNYVLSVPRSGRFRYSVECGPTGKTHTGVVDVPKMEGPRAYRQELVLERNGDLERLVIRNYFDSPLEDDMIALALDEIKRRARLDVSTHEQVVAAPTPALEATHGDVMTRAGFTGDVDQAAAVKLAREDAAELAKEATALDAASGEAFAIAVAAASEADRTAAESAKLVEEAEAADVTEQFELMSEAARLRQQSREANLRAHAAFRTGQDLDAEAVARKQQAAAASKLAAEVSNAVAAKRDEATLPLLVQLKERLDEKGSPDADPGATEKARRAVAENEKAVGRAIAAANAKRTEENELTDRVARLKREQDETRARARKEELAREIAGYEEQLGHLRSETKEAFNKATAIERQTAALRGQASLTRHLTTKPASGPGTELSAAQVEQLGTRITSTDSRLADIAIDERFEAQLALAPEQVEARTFDWDVATTDGAAGSDRAATAAMDRSTTGDAQEANAHTTQVQQTGLGERSTENATVAQVPATIESTDQVGNVSTTERVVDGGTTPAVVAAISTETDERSNNAATEQVEGGDLASTTDAATTDHFLLENERAELEQLAAAERNKTKKDSLQARIRAIDAQLVRETAAADADAQSDPLADPELANTDDVDMTRTALSFTTATKDEEIVAQLYRDYQQDKLRVLQLQDADERADGANGLELMLADSIRAEMTRQVAILQLSPQQAEQVLPRIARLRKLRDEHVAEGEAVLAARREEVDPLSPTQVAMPITSERSATIAQPGVDPINDRFIVLDRYAENVFASQVDHRSTAKGVDDAIAFKEADVARMDALTTEIDSIEAVLEEMPVGRDRDKLRKSTDQLIDERLIIRTDLGQRSAFLSREEWRTATDSMKVLEKTLAARALAADEPIMLMAQGMQADAKRSMDQAAVARKRADRIEDIVERDSLYRVAYREELEALREMDRAITVQNYLAGGEHQRGESLTYEQIASKVLDIPLEAADEPLLASAASATGVQVEEDPENVATTTTGSDMADEPVLVPPSIVVSEQVDDAAANTDPITTDRTTGEVGAQSSTASVPPVVVPAVVSAQTTTAVPSVDVQIQQAEQRLTLQDRAPARLYERYLAGESTTVAANVELANSEPQLLDLRSKRAAQASAEAEQASVIAADRATAFTDSAATARKKKDRERLEMLATKERSLSDSLHTASVQYAKEAEDAARLTKEAEQVRSFRDRLVKFYYMLPEEQQLVMQNEDRSRYFQARTRALEQYAAADDAAGSAKSNREVGALLQEQARVAERDAANGRTPAAEAVERARVLDERAALLFDRADSLDNIASRLRGAASINENQAGVMLQGMPADNSSEIMALEMRTRRTETLLAESRDQAGRVVPVLPPSAGTEQRIEPAVVSIEQPAGTNQARTSEPAATVAVDRSSPIGAIPARMPELLTTNIFELRAPTERRQAAIPMDAALPAGIVFKVQIGAFRNAVPQEAFSDMAPVMGETVGNGLVRYTAGLFVGFDGAANAKDLVRDRGYRDAFVVAYRDGVRIPLGEAMRAEREATATAQQTRTTSTTSSPVAVASIPAPTAIIQAPVAVPATAVEPDLATVLAAYPPTAEEVKARFVAAPDATAYYNVPGAAPARQVETVQGLFFTVQVGVYSKPVPLDKLFNITPLNSERTETAKVRYTTGIFLDMERARVRKDETVGLGVKDAFVTAYLNGKRIPMREANALLEKFGPAILATP